MHRPDVDGLTGAAAGARRREDGGRAGRVLYTSDTDEMKERQAARLGVADFLVKDQITSDELWVRITSNIGEPVRRVESLPDA